MNLIYYHHFNKLDELSHGMNLRPIPPIVQDKMARATSSSEVVLSDLPTTILPYINR